MVQNKRKRSANQQECYVGLNVILEKKFDVQEKVLLKLLRRKLKKQNLYVRCSTFQSALVLLVKENQGIRIDRGQQTVYRKVKGPRSIDFSDHRTDDNKVYAPVNEFRMPLPQPMYTRKRENDVRNKRIIQNLEKQNQELEEKKKKSMSDVEDKKKDSRELDKLIHNHFQKKNVVDEQIRCYSKNLLRIENELKKVSFQLDKKKEEMLTGKKRYRENDYDREDLQLKKQKLE